MTTLLFIIIAIGFPSVALAYLWYGFTFHPMPHGKPTPKRKKK